jgi:5-methylthioadenosine/S-adenosylhomocysteine deaminase
MWPVHQPVPSIVSQSSVANVENVMIAGQWKKWRGQLTYPHLAQRKAELHRSGHRILSELGLTQSH